MADHGIIDWPAWTVSPPGRYVLEWEQAQLDYVVGDIFGYHALQLGLPQLDALRENRMPYRGLVLDGTSRASAPYTAPRAKPSRESGGMGGNGIASGLGVGSGPGSAHAGASCPAPTGASASQNGGAPAPGLSDARASVTALPPRSAGHAPAFARSTIWCEFVELPSKHKASTSSSCRTRSNSPPSRIACCARSSAC
ncbi:MAG: hypothetical protein WDN30_15340 [Pararobbsia sp.]